MNANTAIIEIGQFSLESSKPGTRRWLLGEPPKHGDEEKDELKCEEDLAVIIMSMRAVMALTGGRLELGRVS